MATFPDFRSRVIVELSNEPERLFSAAVGVQFEEEGTERDRVEGFCDIYEGQESMKVEVSSLLNYFRESG